MQNFQRKNEGNLKDKIEHFLSFCLSNFLLTATQSPELITLLLYIAGLITSIRQSATIC